MLLGTSLRGFLSEWWCAKGRQIDSLYSCPDELHKEDYKAGASRSLSLSAILTLDIAPGGGVSQGSPHAVTLGGSLSQSESTHMVFIFPSPCSFCLLVNPSFSLFVPLVEEYAGVLWLPWILKHSWGAALLCVTSSSRRERGYWVIPPFVSYWLIPGCF